MVGEILSGDKAPWWANLVIQMGALAVLLAALWFNFQDSQTENERLSNQLKTRNQLLREQIAEERAQTEAIREQTAALKALTGVH